MSAGLNSEPGLELSLHLPMNGAWSAEFQVASDVELAVGDVVTLNLPEQDFIGRVVRASIFADRLRVRLTGGPVDWSAPVELKHYRNTTVAGVLADLEIEADSDLATEALPFWTRKATTAGEAVQALATMLEVNWRVNPDGTLRLRAETPTTVDPGAVEISRDAARGIVEIAPERAVIVPGCVVGEDQVGDVIYEDGEGTPLRCRYYTEQRARLRGALERLIRWVTRDSLYLGQFTAEVISQAADGTLDLMPDDARLRADGLQGVPIRHGLPGCTVFVPSGERVLLGFDGGDPRSPYAALWHAGQATRIVLSAGTIEAAGTAALALATETKAHLDALQAAHDGHMHPTAGTGPASPPTIIVGALGAIATTKLKGS